MSDYSSKSRTTSDHSDYSKYRSEYSKYRWYIVDVDSIVALPHKIETLRGPWMDVDRDPRKKAKETAGDAVVNYESYIISSLYLLSKCGMILSPPPTTSDSRADRPTVPLAKRSIRCPFRLQSRLE